MNKNYLPGCALGVMKNLNMVIILYITGVTVHSLRGYIHENSALDFLMRIKDVPPEPWKLPVYSLGLYVCLLLLLSVRCENNIRLLMKTALELLIAFFIIYVLNFSYTGIVLLIIADTMSYFSDMRQRILLIASICALYLLLDYNLLSAKYHIVSIESCWEYYRSDIQSILLGIKNILTSLNMFLFIIYAVALILVQLGEKEHILSLNEKLGKANEDLTEANRKLEEYARESEKRIALEGGQG